MDRLDPNLHDVVECPNVHVPIETLQPDSRTREIGTMDAVLCESREKKKMLIECKLRVLTSEITSFDRIPCNVDRVEMRPLLAHFSILQILCN